MKLQIENWISEKGYSNNINKLFEESIICYRNSAYRASLLFSYMGFLTIIKETIIKSNIPTGFTQPEWDSLIIKVNDDDKWEKEVFEALIRTTKPIFPLKEDLRLQIRFWKDRRNDCAHFKNNEIESHHTEAFWSFIKSNIPKITVEGGMETLLNKFEDHFDQTKTPPNSDFTNLVREIENSVSTTEYHDFFKRVEKRIYNIRFYSPDVHPVYCKILDITSPAIQESLIDYLKQENIDINFLASFPDKVTQLGYSPTDIREIWKSRMYNVASNINPYNIYSGLLRNNCIPNEQIEEAHREIFNKFHQVDYHRLPEEKDIATLKANRFFDIIFKIAIEEQNLSSYLWVNNKCDIIISFFENYPLNIETVKCICNMAASRNPSEWLIRELKTSFINTPELKTKFQEFAEANEITLPLVFR